MLLENKIAVVTGSARGIGKGIAEVLSRNGASVVFCDIDEDEVKKSADEINRRTGIATKAFGFDITHMSDIRKLVDFVIKEFGRIDILVNNAGVIILQSFDEVDEKSWDKTYAVNVKGPFFLSQAVANIMMKQRKGKIINISSDSAMQAWPNETSYSSSKAALLALTRVLALELGPYNINCNAICPGATDTPMLRGFGKERIEECIEATCLKRIAKPKDIGNVALFLASHLSDHITGEHLVVSAGEVMSQ